MVTATDRDDGHVDAVTTEDLRPAFHFTPTRNWMNDPNGPILVDGTYHVYFQHNPHGDAWGNISWGHASSRDLVEWTEHPVAIDCAVDEMVFSGSVVYDEDDTASFVSDESASTGALVAIYTSVEPTGRQSQALAFSTDGGFEWTRFAGNPVLDRRSNDFRDPKVVRYRGDDEAFWLMTVVEAVERTVLLYRSENLRDWTLLSTFSTPDPPGQPGQVWECPDLLCVPSEDGGETVWVLVVSVNPGAPGGGSGTMYFVGDFDGCSFKPRDLTPRWLDLGCDYYAATSFAGLAGGRVVTLAWMSNWRYAAGVPTNPWRGGLSLPRELRYGAGQAGADGEAPIVLRQQVAAELVATVGPPTTPAAVPFSLGTVQRFDRPTGCRLRLTIDPGTATAVELSLFAARDPAVDPGITVRYSPADQMIELQRRAVGPAIGLDGFEATVSAPLDLIDGLVDIVVWLDAASIELQNVAGTLWITMLAFADGDPTEWTLAAVGGTATVHRLEVSTVGPTLTTGM